MANSDNLIALTELVERLTLLVGEMAWGVPHRMEEATAIQREAATLRTRIGVPFPPAIRHRRS